MLINLRVNSQQQQQQHQQHHHPIFINSMYGLQVIEMNQWSTSSTQLLQQHVLLFLYADKHLLSSSQLNGVLEFHQQLKKNKKKQQKKNHKLLKHKEISLPSLPHEKPLIATHNNNNGSQQKKAPILYRSHKVIAEVVDQILLTKPAEGGSNAERNSMIIFLTVFRKFMRPIDLVSILVQRFEMDLNQLQQYNNSNSQATAAKFGLLIPSYRQEKISSIFSYWLSHYWNDFKSPVTRRLLSDFLIRISKFKHFQSMHQKVSVLFTSREAPALDIDALWGVASPSQRQEEEDILFQRKKEDAKKDSGYFSGTTMSSQTAPSTVAATTMTAGSEEDNHQWLLNEPSLLSPTPSISKSTCSVMSKRSGIALSSSTLSVLKSNFDSSSNSNDEDDGEEEEEDYPKTPTSPTSFSSFFSLKPSVSTLLKRSNSSKLTQLNNSSSNGLNTPYKNDKSRRRSLYFFQSSSSIHNTLTSTATTNSTSLDHNSIDLAEAEAAKKRTRRKSTPIVPLFLQKYHSVSSSTIFTALSNDNSNSLRQQQKRQHQQQQQAELNRLAIFAGGVRLFDDTTTASMSHSSSFNDQQLSSLLPSPSRTTSIILEDIVFFITLIQPSKIAEQLTWIEMKLFQQIQPRDFLRRLWIKHSYLVQQQQLTHRSEDKGNANSENSANNNNNNSNSTLLNNPLYASIEHFNFMSGWIATIILKITELDQRVLVFEQCMKIALELKQLKNYNTLMAVLAGMNNAAISRLRQTRALLQRKNRPLYDQFLELETLMSSEKSFSNYRTALRNHDTDVIPGIPYLGIHQQDLISLDEANKDFLQDGKVHWKKFSLIGESILEVLRFQQQQQQNGFLYSIIPDPKIISFIGQSKIFTEDEQYEKSITIEPRISSLKPSPSISSSTRTSRSSSNNMSTAATATQQTTTTTTTASTSTPTAININTTTFI
ncbi:ras guanine nucleotide exchange factor domain-containing protein [Mycotypha africana]|uniref:ras guanine nucleotide exchange factor domain-containing protein n=1 Tax=Mycotypha africana TaxID=64632 RepID=UPI002300A241|nr:ras guanine nucleotide exchange factor domain-containing protein [Mycotypha africana]KAI8991011.1 ras guanine nucleotide exchange factor domain-containing protein [Mycotypha africana]